MKFLEAKGRDATASDIQRAASAILNDKKTLSENVQLSASSSQYGLPYFLFDASDMNSPDPDLFYVNNQLKMKACEVGYWIAKPYWGLGICKVMKFINPL